MGETGVSAVATSIWGNFTGAFAIRLGATTLQMSLFGALTELLTALSGLAAPAMVALLGGRKKSVAITVAVSSVPWLFIAAVPFLAPALGIWVLILSSALAIALLIVTDPIWGSWMADLVPDYRRGGFLGARGSLATLVSIAVGITGAAVLDKLTGGSIGFTPQHKWAFTALFLVAFSTRIVSAILFSAVVDPRPDLRISFGMMPKVRFASLGTTPLGRHHTFVFVFHIAAGLAGPFLALYFLRQLSISYVTYVGLGAASGIATVITMPFWGKLADVKGNIFVIALSAAAVSVSPMLLLISSDLWYLFVIQVGTGVLTAGWGLSLYNFVIEKSDDENRPAEVAFFHAMASTGSFIGTLIGGFVASHLPAFNGSQFLTMFLVSGVLRTVSTAVLLPMSMKESWQPS